MMSEGQPTSESEQPARQSERLDEDGLPLDRKPTLDDVRGDAGSGRAIAIGCTLLVAAVLGLFWLIRAGLLG